MKTTTSTMLAFGVGLAMLVTSCKKETPCTPLSTTTSGSVGTTKAGHESRPFSDYLSTQGTTSLFVPPYRDFMAATSSWSEPVVRSFAMDYNGFVAEYLRTHGGKNIDTKVTGKIDELPMKDGRAKVTVTIHTENAIAFSIIYDVNSTATDQFLTNAVDFGVRTPDLLTDTTLTPALGNCDIIFTFINPSMGAPIPDFTYLDWSTVIDYTYRASAVGTLHASSGFPEGTPGRVIVDQRGLLHTNANGKYAGRDAFPVENITYKATPNK